MKIKQIDSLHCDAGWRIFSFLKITTDDGLIGYSEYNESYGSKGVTGVIEKLTPLVIGHDALAHEHIHALLYATTRQAPGGINAQAIAAIENALLDIKGKALGVPVHALLGGACRDRLRLYWSHCGSYRMSEVTAKHLGKPQLKSLDDVARLGEEVKASGYTALKTNIFIFGDAPYLHMPGFARNATAPQVPELNAERDVIAALTGQIAALREGAGEDMDILLDLNFNFKTEGYLKVGRALEHFDLFWYEIDLFDPKALALIRTSLRTPIASCESLFGTREFRPYFEQQSMDVAIVDVPWNGIWQSYKIAVMADAYEVNVAPHNFYGHLSTLMSAHFCAALPNFRIMEIDVDDVPWKDDLVTHPPQIADGHLLVPQGPGWGSDVNEEAVRAHPPRT
jgi:L-alanine-DL-glutamate epimerase-like enolase superfamily enzyme